MKRFQLIRIHLNAVIPLRSLDWYETAEEISKAIDSRVPVAILADSIDSLAIYDSIQNRYLSARKFMLTETNADILECPDWRPINKEDKK